VLENLNLDIGDGEFLVLLGSSGCGKSTLLNCIAGLLDVSDGQIHIKGRNVTWEEPKDRGIGMVFQSYALYPQMTVQGNLSFGLKNAGIAKQEVIRRVQHAAEVLQIQQLLDRKPAQLSGGQRQRVAIGRALVREVDVFLFDEPLSNLDAKLRAELRVEIKRLHQKLNNTMVYVTHDQVEAMTLADRIAVMKDGGIQQLAAPYDIYNKPVNKFVAGFIGSPGINFLAGELSLSNPPVFHANGTDIVLDDYVFDGAGQREGVVFLGIRPEHVSAGAAAQDAPVTARVVVDVVEPMGSDTLVWTTLAGQDFRFRVDGQSKLQPGDSTNIGLYPGKACLFDATSELRL
jgi:multiple sugar transport system ATP-binding protein